MNMMLFSKSLVLSLTKACFRGSPLILPCGLNTHSCPKCVMRAELATLTSKHNSHQHRRTLTYIASYMSNTFILLNIIPYTVKKVLYLTEYMYFFCIVKLYCKITVNQLQHFYSGCRLVPTM